MYWNRSALEQGRGPSGGGAVHGAGAAPPAPRALCAVRLECTQNACEGSLKLYKAENRMYTFKYTQQGG
jgi:hypothetical protein